MHQGAKVERLRGATVVDVINAEELRIAQDSGAAAVRIPSAAIVPLAAPREEVAEHTRQVREMLKAAQVPVICRVPAGRYAEARLWIALGAEMVFEGTGEETVCAHPFEVPVLCAVSDWGEGLRRIARGASALCVQAESSQGVLRALKQLHLERHALASRDRDAVEAQAAQAGVPADLLLEARAVDRLPGLIGVDAGATTPGTAVLWRQLGADFVFVSNAVFRAKDPVAQIRGIAEVVAHPRDAEVLLRVCEELGDPIPGIVASGLFQPELFWREWAPEPAVAAVFASSASEAPSVEALASPAPAAAEG